MTVSADPAALERMMDELNRTKRDLDHDVSAAQSAANRTLAQVRYALARAIEEERAAEAALRQCLSSDSATCSAEYARLARARTRVGNARTAMAILDSALETFRQSRLRFTERSQILTSEGLRYLREKHRKLIEMGQLTGAIAQAGGSGGSSQSATGGTPGASASAVQPDQPVPGLPTGFCMVAMSQVDMSTCRVTSPADFTKGYSPADLAWAYDALDQVILPGLAQGQTKDDFEAMDNRAGRYGVRSYTDTYSGFLNPTGDPLRLRPLNNGLYAIDGGHHRVWLAQQLGRTEIPVVVVR